MEYILKFGQIDKSYLPCVGGKGANLGELMKAGFRVPQGFCITTEAYRTFIGCSDMMQSFFDQLDGIQHDDLSTIRAMSETVRSHLDSIPMPLELEEAIVQAWMTTGERKAYAVRSSATAEDLPSASFAGQQETYLNVCGKTQLLRAVRRAWSSLFTDRAISYRTKNGFSHSSVFLSVVIQEMVFPEVSGILFTADPITGNRNITSIDASFGLGEALVSGIVTSDLYQVKETQIIQKKIANKKVAIYANPGGGTVTKQLSPEKQEEQALLDEQIAELAVLGKRIEQHYGKPQDIEWCLSKGNFYIVQSRPITSLYPVPKVSDERLHVFMSVGHQQMMTDAMRPLGISVLRTFFPVGKQASRAEESEVVLEAGNRLFFDLTELLYLKLARRVVPRILSNIDERIGSALEEISRRSDFLRTPSKGLKRGVFRVVRTAAKHLVFGLLFRDTSKAIEAANEFMEQKVAECKHLMSEVSGAERIKLIKENLGNLVMSIISTLVPYLPAGIASMKLVEVLVKKWCGDNAEIHLLNKSLTGNVTSELGLVIGDLADIARESPSVISYLKEAQDGTFFAGLKEISGGEVFCQAFEEFLDKYGMRCPGEIDITNYRWRERPTMLVPSILSHIETLLPSEHRTKFAQGKKEAEDAANRIISCVRKTRGGILKARIMARLIRVYRDTLGLREHPKYIVIRHLDVYRQAILEEGRALVGRGVISKETDVFYLSLDEILLQLSKDTKDDNLDIQSLIRSRKKQFEENKNISPPRVMTSEGEIITGKKRDKQAPVGALIGTPVSAGIVEGYARIVLHPNEANLHPGEIMIAPFTDPGWTPLFHSARGLVMEVGGMMTHGAVVAREYGIPAVVGIDNATEMIKNGQYVRINGTEGYVEILQS